MEVKFMLCDECKSAQATVNIMENINGIKKSYRLCERCYLKLRASSENNNIENGSKSHLNSFDELFDMNVKMPSLGSELSDLFSNFPSILGPDKRFEKTCSVCGTTSGDFKETGLVGCSACYRQLQDAVLPQVQKSQGASVHRGKMPAARKKKIVSNEHLQKLYYDLNEAKREENYEKARIIQNIIDSYRDKK